MADDIPELTEEDFARMTTRAERIRSERALFNLLRQERDTWQKRHVEDDRPLADHWFEKAGIPPKRGYAILEKWSRKGWWDSGVTIRAGWFTDKAPKSL